MWIGATRSHRTSPPQRVPIGSRLMRIATFNCRGSTPPLETLFTLLNLDILCLTETWADTSPPQTPLFTAHVLGYSSPNRHRRGGGVTILSKLPIKQLRATSSREFQSVSIRTPNGITISACYLAPNLPLAKSTKSILPLHADIRGPTIICGDFNARTRDWDSSHNTNGSSLRSFIRRFNLQVSAPGNPTFKNSSVVDIFLSKGLTPTTCLTESGTWDTDHKLALCIFSQDLPLLTRKVPLKMVNDPKLKEKASREYKAKIPNLTNTLLTCQSAEHLETISADFVTILHHPFNGTYSAKPRRFRLGWNHHLDNLAKKRNKLIKRNGKTPTLDLQRQIKDMDKEIRRKRRTNIRISRMKHAKDIESLPPTEAAIRFARKRCTLYSKPEPTIQGETMTTHLQSLQTHDAKIKPTTFTPTPTFDNMVHSALLRSPSSRAPGPDGITVEMLRIEPTICAKFITTLWRTVGILGHIPENLRNGTITPVYKNGDSAKPGSYRPICLVSHIRKVISSALNVWLTQTYRFHPYQFGFTADSGTEVATLNASALATSTHHHFAILDLKGAYDRVRRDMLLQLCYERLPLDLARSIQNLLVPLEVSSKNSTTQLKAKITLGVPQGDPLSPSLYNIFMDTFMERYNSVGQSISKTPAQCYADDVILSALTAPGLQILLDIASQWSSHTHMTWSIAKCHALSLPANKFSISNSAMETVKEASYLGSSLTTIGLGEASAMKRFKSATNKLFEWIRRERETITLRRNTKSMLVLRFLLPAVDFGTHLLVPSPLLTQTAVSFERKCIRWILRNHDATNLTRLRSITRFPGFDTRRTIHLYTRLVRTWDKAISRYWTPGIHPNAQKLSRDHYELLRLQPGTESLWKSVPRLPSIQSSTPNTARALQKVRSFKRKQLTNIWEAGNLRNKRKLPTRCAILPCTTASDPASFLADKWYLNNLPRLHPLAYEQLDNLLTKESWSAAEKARFEECAKSTTQAILRSQT